MTIQKLFFRMSCLISLAAAPAALADSATLFPGQSIVVGSTSVGCEAFGDVRLNVGDRVTVGRTEVSCVDDRHSDRTRIINVSGSGSGGSLNGDENGACDRAQDRARDDAFSNCENEDGFVRDSRVSSCSCKRGGPNGSREYFCRANATARCEVRR